MQARASASSWTATEAIFRRSSAATGRRLLHGDSQRVPRTGNVAACPQLMVFAQIPHDLHQHPAVHLVITHDVLQSDQAGAWVRPCAGDSAAHHHAPTIAPQTRQSAHHPTASQSDHARAWPLLPPSTRIPMYRAPQPARPGPPSSGKSNQFRGGPVGPVLPCFGRVVGPLQEADLGGGPVDEARRGQCGAPGVGEPAPCAPARASMTRASSGSVSASTTKGLEVPCAGFRGVHSRS